MTYEADLCYVIVARTGKMRRMNSGDDQIHAPQTFEVGSSCLVVETFL